MKQLDLRLLPLALALWVGSAIGLHSTLTPAMLVGLVCVVSGAALLRGGRRLFAAWLVAFALGVLLAALRVDAASPRPIEEAIADAGVVEFVAVIDAEPSEQQRRGFGGLEVQPVFIARATLTAVSTGSEVWHTSMPVTLQWNPDGMRHVVGEQVSGRSIPRADDIASRSAYWIRVQGALEVERRESRGAWLATQVRNGLALVTHAESAGDGAALLPGLVLGDTRAQSSQLVDDLRVSGLSHLTAVSGANLAIVIAALMWMLQRTRIRARYRHLVVLFGICSFVVVVQPQPSVVRAAMMGGISVIALASGSRRVSASTLWLSIVVLLVVDPFLAWQWGFVLSVAATAGLIVMSPRLRPLLGDRWWSGALAVTLSAQLATFPVLLAMGRPPTWLSIPANLICEPLVAPATVSGFLAAILAGLSLVPNGVLSSIALAVASVVAWPGVRLSDVVAWVAHRGVSTPFAVAPVQSIVGLLVVMCSVVLLLRLRIRRRIWAALMVACVVFTTWFPEGVGHDPPRDWWYVMCDVGQGDSSVVNVGEAVIVIDAGPDPDAERRCLRRLGVRHVAAFIVTHFHADHVEGVAGLVQAATIDAAYSTPIREPLVEWQRVEASLQRPLQPLQAGDQLSIGDVRISVLWPDVRQTTGEPNNSSLVLDVERGGIHLLVTGDADPAAQAALALPVRGYAVLKVPHHGSRFQDDGFVERVAPVLALVSVGAGNDYGHPAVSTMDAYRRAGIVTLRTDLVGTIAVSVRGGRLTYAALSG